MTDGIDLREALRAHLDEPEWMHHAQSILVTTGVLAFGVALGVKWAAVDTLNPPSRRHLGVELAPIYNHHMTVALAVALVTLVVGVGLTMRGAE